MRTFSAYVVSLFHVFTVTDAGSFLNLQGINDCFERVAIGKRLNSSDVTKTISTTNIKQCSNECERMLCNTYSYGLNGNGNGTCLLGLDLPKSGPYDDPEYDLFMKILQCRDRTTCFIKLVGGRRLTDKYIQRTLPADSKGDCEIYCEYEKEFRCEGFNFRYDMKLDSYSSCQLSSVSSEKLDLSLDFQSDVEYDYFEKNVNASPSCRYAELAGPYGQRRKWGGSGDEQDLWQDLSPQWQQGNEVAYGDVDRVFYDQLKPGVQDLFSGGGGGGVSLVRPTNLYNNDVRLLYNNLQPTLTATAVNRLPASINECFIKARTGHHLQQENIIKSTNAPSLYGCETMCANEQTFTCNIFSYRYSFTSSMDNCHLGDKMLRQLDIFQDLVPDRDCDVFARNELSQPGCQPAKNWDTDCFERIRSGLTLEGSIVKFSVQTENLHECELICLHVKHFTCRVFSFRRGPPVIGKWSDNCYLTDYPVLDMDPVKHFVQDSGCDVYNRGSYGRGCELDKVLPQSGWPLVPGQDLTPTVLTTYRPQYGVPPPLTPSLYGPKYGPPSSPPLQFFPIVPSESPSPTPSPSPPPPLPSPSPPPQPPQYYPVGPHSSPSPPPQYFPPPSTLSPPSGYYPVTPTVFNIPTRPTGTYVPSMPPTTFFQIPGEYTPVSVRPTNRLPGVPGGVYNDLFNPYGQNPTQVPTVYGMAKKLCYINFGGTARLLPSAIKKSMTVESEYQCKMECNKARENQYFRCSTLSYFGGYCELSDIEMRDLKPNQHFSLDQQFLLYTWDFSEVHCFSSPVAKYSPTNGFSGGLEWTWMRFTVNGQPCRLGSYCTENVNMGIWSCPVDQGDWDYCCRPDHKCGYSEGVSYPWCHVGKSTDQWRPCSDKYFPSTDGPPQTWPMTYIHHTGPPVVHNPSSPLPPHGDNNNSNNHNGNNNGTQTEVKHEQSLVDQFLSIFTSSSTDVSSNAVSSPEPVAEASTASSKTTKFDLDLLPGFQVVDVTDKPQSTSKLYSYHKNNYNSNRIRNRFVRKRPVVYI
ncbi:PREDICTED: uncharacterized protein LOC107161309 isoform X1 [Diuraphis noxia]|uniref:uncharacterized protein LOC107161309 isoform X1 n=1 Tax=Diuraphis noxia TaxID=143948 RepID=UPI0007638537|nr:PREDICTED: uncharacterized protein LOC107161309 isoform X1 [Diuraphis noxia]